jgi:hypothetical protein
LDLIPGDTETPKAHILWAIVSKNSRRVDVIADKPDQAYEACKASQCWNFVLTNYDYWVFGSMSNEYTTACVTQVFGRNSSVCQLPNILQLLTYWDLRPLVK